jgi:pentatricopeptide repeat protein
VIIKFIFFFSNFPFQRKFLPLTKPSPMLKFLNIARPFNAARSIPLLLTIRVNTGVALRNRAYSSTPPRPCIKTKQYNAKTKGPRKWLTKEEAAFLNSLLLLVQERKFDDLFGSLNDYASLTPLIFAKLIQPSWKTPLEREIELKERVMTIMKDCGVKHTAFSITPMISLYGKIGDTIKADALLEMMIDEGIKRDHTIYNSLMKCHGNNTPKIDQIFAWMKEDGIKPDVYTYNSMIKAFSRDLVNVEKLYLEMIEGGIKPDVYTYSTMIKAFSRELIKVEKLYLEMIEESIKPDVVIYNTMIDLFAKNGKTVKAIEVFASMKKDEIKPDLYTYNSMIDAYAKNGMFAKAIEMFRSTKKDEIKLDVYTYNTMIDAYAKSGHLEKAIEMFALMKKDGIKPNVTTFGALLDCYAKSGKHLDDIMYILKEMKGSSVVPNIIAWNNIMEGFSRAVGEKDQKKAISIWKYLSGDQSYESLGLTLPVKVPSVFPTSVTLSIALDICKYGRFEKEADDVWNYGQENDRVVLESNVLTSYAECLASFEEKGADRAVGLILRGIKGEKMPLRCVKPDKKTIKHAQSSLRSKGWKNHAAKLDGVEIKE